LSERGGLFYIYRYKYLVACCSDFHRRSGVQPVRRFPFLVAVVVFQGLTKPG
jgi:hypothetical protein